MRVRAEAVGMRSFNPLPPSKRGETHHRSTIVAHRRSVSIRSPPSKRGETDFSSRHYMGIHCFNPLPPSKRGETRLRATRAGSKNRFNPLPPSKRGETSGCRRNDSALSMFQSAPPVETRGDTLCGFSNGNI